MGVRYSKKAQPVGRGMERQRSIGRNRVYWLVPVASRVVVPDVVPPPETLEV
jgi:hypothetical protein